MFCAADNMTGPDRARRLHAKYSFAGVQAEMDKTVPLHDGENVLAEGRVSIRYWSLLSRLAYARLTNERLDVLAHYALQPDHIIEIPSGAVTSVDSGSGLSIAYLDQGGESARIRLAAIKGGGRMLVLSPTMDPSSQLRPGLEEWARSSRDGLSQPP